MSGRNNDKVGGAVASLILMFKKEILKGATSKHEKKCILATKRLKTAPNSNNKLIFR